MNALRRLTYGSGLLALVRFLHLSRVLRKSYYRWAASPGEILHAKVIGIDVQFRSFTPAELRGMEGTFVTERDFFQVLVSSLRPGDVFIDVGSHIGQFAIPLAKVVGEQGLVVAFEPESQAYKRLLDHLGLNGLSNVRVFKKALGEENGRAQLFVGGEACPSLRPHHGETEQQSVSESVEIVQGDWFRKSEKIPIPRAIKIDVEGYEYSVLRGLQGTLAHPGCELLCLEIHRPFLPPEVTVERVIELVKYLGFSRLDVCRRRTEIHVIGYKSALGHGAS